MILSFRHAFREESQHCLCIYHTIIQVLYRALDEAAKQEADVLIVDTSGRLANNAALNAELVKMRKVNTIYRCFGQKLDYSKP